MLKHRLQTIGEFCSHFLADIEAFSKTHTGLLVFLGLAIGGVQALLAYRGIVKRKTTTPENLLLPLDPNVRLDLLNKVESEWVHDRLHQGLRNAIRVDLKLTEALAAVRPMLRIHTIAESGQPEERTIDEDILSIFKRANGRLLILGEPGTGKTNLLMELAEGLIAEAKMNRTLPIPIVFSLSRWTLGDRVRSLADWMIDDLADVAQYGLSRSTSGALVRQNLITPLLDGLDEVGEERRTDCTEAIHAYLQERDLGKLAICCRIAEYERLPRLYLRTAIRVEKLSRAEVERYVSMVRLTHVRRALEGDPELWKIIDTPLLLHVAVLASEVEPLGGSPSLPPRDRLYARFVNYALGRKVDDSPRKQTDAKPLKHWLGCLAAEMKQRDQTQFSFEGLDDSWLHTTRAARWLVTLTCALFFGIIFGVFIGLADGLAAGLIAVLVVELVLWLVRGVQVIEELYFAWYKWREALSGAVLCGALIAGLVGGLSVGLAVGLKRGPRDGMINGVISALVSGLGLVLVIVLDEILQPKPVSGSSSPNQGTLRSLRYAVILLLLGMALSIGVRIALPRDLSPPLVGALFAGVTILTLSKGGLFTISHYVVRLLLWRNGAAPLRYVRFLNEAAERVLLTRRGGSYEFFHITFRDYMADRYGSKDSKQ
jgi:hypothetical protein